MPRTEGMARSLWVFMGICRYRICLMYSSNPTWFVGISPIYAWCSQPHIITYPYFQGEMTFVLVTFEVCQIVIKLCSKIDKVRVSKTVISNHSMIILINHHKYRQKEHRVDVVSRVFFTGQFSKRKKKKIEELTWHSRQGT